LDFSRRQVSNVQVLGQKVTVVEKQGGFELHIDCFVNPTPSGRI